jgi:hypothetical protein
MGFVICEILWTQKVGPEDSEVVLVQKSDSTLINNRLNFNFSVDHILKTTEKDKAKLNRIIVFEMNSSSPSSLTSTAPSKVSNDINNSNKEKDIVTLTEKNKPKKDQY